VIKVDRGLEKSFVTLGDICRWVKNQCSRKLVDWSMSSFGIKQNPKPSIAYLKYKNAKLQLLTALGFLQIETFCSVNLSPSYRTWRFL
jgi:hypothetical protein